MRMIAITCLAALVVVTSLAEPVEAGRRGRRTRRVVAAAGVVAVASRRPNAVAVVPVVTPSPAVVPRASVVLTPDLTITDISTEGELHCITVKNIGQAASPETSLRIDFHRAIDRVLISSRVTRVSPLLVNQSVRYRVHMLPGGTGQVIAKVDPGQKVFELNEKNNDLMLEIAKQPEVEPAPLEDVEVWVELEVTGSEAKGVQANNDSED